MKKFLILAIVALFASPSVRVQAQETAGSVASSEEAQYKNYHRIFFGYAPTIFYEERGRRDDSDALHGFNVGWLGGFNVTGKRLPLYLEAGAKANVGLGELLSDFDKYLAIEVPLNVAYRFHIPNTKIHLSPYMGLHFKANVLGRGKGGFDYFDLEGTKRFQFGMQAGGHFDFNHFNVGLGYSFDFLPIQKMSDYDYKVTTWGLFLNLGLVF